MVVTGPIPAGTEPVSPALDAPREAGIDAVLFDPVEVEPTGRSLLTRTGTQRLMPA